MSKRWHFVWFFIFTEIAVSCSDMYNMPIQNITVCHIRQELINLTKYSNSCISHIYILVLKKGLIFLLFKREVEERKNVEKWQI